MVESIVLYFGLLLSIVWVIVGVYFYHFYRRRPGDGSTKTKRFFEATVARQLVPRFEPLVRTGDLVTIVGGDGTYHASFGGPLWVDALRSWLKRGAAIDYLIVDGDPSSSLPLVQLSLEFSDRFRLRFADVAAIAATSRDLINDFDALRYTHPVLLQNEAGVIKAVWFEGYHEAGSHIARNVQYIAATDIETYRGHRAFQYIEKAKRLLAVVKPTDISVARSVLSKQEQLVA